jgi:hypothetical protein
MSRHRDSVLAACGASLRAWRESQEPELSQTAAAERIGASQGAWAAWEGGRKAPDTYYGPKLEELTKGHVTAAAWAFPRKGTKAASEESSARLVEDCSLHATEEAS